jgi:hypothetical protein
MSGKGCMTASNAISKNYAMDLTQRLSRHKRQGCRTKFCIRGNEIMRGSAVFQVQALWRESGINQIGQSRHDAKNAVRSELAERGLSVSAQNISQSTGIHSYNSADAYRGVWIAIMRHAKSQYGIKNIEKLSGEHVASFLNSKVAEGVRYATFQQYAAAGEKLAVALNGYAEIKATGERYDFTGSIKEIRQQAQVSLERFTGSRAYENPSAVIAAIANADHRLAAQLQLSSGARVSGVALIRENQLKGIVPDPVSGKTLGCYEVRGKGGKITMHFADVSIYKALEIRIASQGHFSVDKNAYRDSIRQGCVATGSNYSGSHGFRWNFASERFDQCMKSGRTYEQALAQVAREMSHERVGITEHYRR